MSGAMLVFHLYTVMEWSEQSQIVFSFAGFCSSFRVCLKGGTTIAFRNCISYAGIVQFIAGCHCVTVTVTVSLCHCVTVSLCHCVTVTVSLCHYVTLPLSLCHSHRVTLSLCHCVTVTLSLCHSVTLSDCWNGDGKKSGSVLLQAYRSVLLEWLKETTRKFSQL